MAQEPIANSRVAIAMIRALTNARNTTRWFFHVLVTSILFFVTAGPEKGPEKGPVRDDLPLAPLDLPARISVMPLRTERFSGSTLVPLVRGPKLYTHCRKARGRSDKLNVINAVHKSFIIIYET